LRGNAGSFVCGPIPRISQKKKIRARTSTQEKEAYYHQVARGERGNQKKTSKSVARGGRRPRHQQQKIVPRRPAKMAKPKKEPEKYPGAVPKPTPQPTLPGRTGQGSVHDPKIRKKKQLQKGCPPEDLNAPDRTGNTKIKKKKRVFAPKK